MATLPRDENSHGKGGKPPVSAHPAFAAIVALWFAALLGLGTFVLPGALLERAVMAARLPDLIPAASPPLGMTARLLAALAAAAIGAIAGLAIARRVAAAQPVHARRKPRPIIAHEELGHDGLDAPTLAPPLAPPLALADAPAPLADEPLLLEPELTDEVAATEDAFVPILSDQGVLEGAEWKQADEPFAEFKHPLAFTPPSLHREQAATLRESPNDHNASELFVAEPARMTETLREDLMAAPLEDLKLVQLVQRLDSSLRRRREWMAKKGVHAALPPADRTVAEDAAWAKSAYFAASPADPHATANGESGKFDEPVKPRDAEEALRSALATLQRISGAA